MIRRLIALVVFGLFAYAGWHVGLAWFHAQKFEDAVKEIALFGASKSDEALATSVLGAAADNHVPLDPDFIEISRRSEIGTNDHVVIKVSYAMMVPILPGKARRFDFTYSTP